MLSSFFKFFSKIHFHVAEFSFAQQFELSNFMCFFDVSDKISRNSDVTDVFDSLSERYFNYLFEKQLIYLEKLIFISEV